MRIVILDPGFEHAHAHHESVNLGVARTAAAAGHDVAIAAGHNLSADSRRACVAEGVIVSAHFRTPCYPESAHALPSEPHGRFAQQFADEIAALFDFGFLGPDDAILLHTGFSFHLSGLAQALWRLQSQRRGAVVVSLMYNAGARQAPDGRLELLDPREHVRHRVALRLLATVSGGHVYLATSCRTYQRVLQALWSGGDVGIHPAVGYRPLDTSPRPASPRHRVLLYLGGPKEDKGIVFATRLGAEAALSMPGHEFVFHYNHEFPAAEQFAAAVRALCDAGRAHDNVRIVEGRLDEARYDELLSQADTLCLLYDPREYGFKTSGVLWDGLRASPARWLVSDGTWMAEELNEIGVPHARVPYGDVATALASLKEAPSEVRRCDETYLGQLLRPFGDWVVERVTAQTTTASNVANVAPQLPKAKRRLRILVVRTDYGHFSPLSGPGGFVPYLSDMGHEVEDWRVPLGHQWLWQTPQRDVAASMEAVQSWLKSYQGNSFEAETRLQREARRWDVVHFVDGEHCGLLAAVARLAGGNRTPRLVATSHQPTVKMHDLVADDRFLRGFDRVHLLSPCQSGYFESRVQPGALHVIPHGIAPEVLNERLLLKVTGSVDPVIRRSIDQKVAGRKIVLCVGSWLRDYSLLLQTAALLERRSDLAVVAVGKALQLDVPPDGNVIVVNGGIPDAVLHSLYRDAEVLLLPLTGGAANNAVLESLAHGLPIVTADLPSTRFYTAGLAEFCPPNAGAYADAVAHLLARLQHQGVRQNLSARLRDRAVALSWATISRRMSAELYEGA